MTQDERWLANWKEVMDFITANHRNPSRHRIEEHDMLNWLKANRKVMNKGEMKAERVEKFGKLLEMTEQYKRINQRRRMMYDGLRYNYTNEITWYVRFQLPHQESANCHIKNRPTATFIVKKVAEFEGTEGSGPVVPSLLPTSGEIQSVASDKISHSRVC